MRPAFVVVLCVALLVAILPRPALAQDFQPRPRLISVTGTAEVNVAPDEAILSLGVESRDKDLTVAKSQHDRHVRKLLAEARSAGVEEKNIHTSTLQMQPVYSEEKVPRFLAYEVSQSIQVTLKDLSKYENLLTKLLESGVNRVDNVEFLVAEPRKYRDDARVKAIRAAREKASLMAAELGQTIGKPWDISEDNFDSAYAQANNFQTRGFYNQNSSSYAGAPATQESTVALGEVSIRASVRVSFQLE